jgi:hypothetical protein
MFRGLMIMSNHVSKADKNPPEWIGQSDFSCIACALYPVWWHYMVD